jgi:hypothetical protein
MVLARPRSRLHTPRSYITPAIPLYRWMRRRNVPRHPRTRPCSHRRGCLPIGTLSQETGKPLHGRWGLLQPSRGRCATQFRQARSFARRHRGFRGRSDYVRTSRHAYRPPAEAPRPHPRRRCPRSASGLPALPARESNCVCFFIRRIRRRSCGHVVVGHCGETSTHQAPSTIVAASAPGVWRPEASS